MILQLYILFFVITFIFLALGYFSHDPDADMLKIVGFGFLFILGIMLFDAQHFGNVENCNNKLTFSEEIYIYGDDYTGYHYDDYNATLHAGTLELFHKEINNTYTEFCTPYESKTFGFYIAVLGALGFASAFLQIKSGRESLK